MDINSVNSVANNYSSITKTKSTKKTEASSSTNSEELAAVYKKTDSASASSNKKTNKATIDKLKADAEQRNQQLQSLVSKMFSKQGITFSNSSEMYSILRSGNYEVDADVKAQAQADIAEDGYWGVEQTSDRLVSFAQALSGGDANKADELIAAIKKGFEQATGEWGDDLPDICQRTLDTTIKKMEKWRDGIE